MRQLKWEIITRSKRAMFKKHKCTLVIFIPVLGSSLSLLTEGSHLQCAGRPHPLSLSWARLKRSSSPTWCSIAKCTMGFYHSLSIHICTRLHAKSINKKEMKEVFFWQVGLNTGSWDFQIIRDPLGDGLQSKRAVKQSHLGTLFLDLHDAVWISHRNDVSIYNSVQW